MHSLTGYATVDCLNCDFCNYRISVIVGSCGLQGVLYGITYEQPQGVKPQRLKAIHPSHTENRDRELGICGETPLRTAIRAYRVSIAVGAAARHTRTRIHRMCKVIHQSLHTVRTRQWIPGNTISWEGIVEILVVFIETPFPDAPCHII